MDRSRLAVAVFVVQICVAAPGSLHAAGTGPVNATHVLYAYAHAPSTPGGQTWATWDISCSTEGPGWTVAVPAQGVIYSSPSMPGYYMRGEMWTAAPRTTGGQLVQVGDLQVAHEPRTEVPSTQRHTELLLREFGGRAGYEHTSVVVVAFWGDAATCEMSYDERPVPVHRAFGANAFVVGPEGFTGGAFAQHGGTQAAAARTFSTWTDGGPAWATMTLGRNISSAMVHGDALDIPPTCVSKRCEYEAAENTFLTASLVAGANLHGDAFSALQVIHLPPIPAASLPRERFPEI